MKTKIYFRADGNSQMGLGHVIRSLALAEMLQLEFQCFFLIKNLSPKLTEQISTTGISAIHLPPDQNKLEEAQYIIDNYLLSTDIIVLDGYHYTTDYQYIILKSGGKLVCIDDIHACHFLAHAIINHTGGIAPSAYSKEPYSKLFIGLAYCLLRRPFREVSISQKKLIEEPSVFICFGGADPHNDTLVALQLCETNFPPTTTLFVILGIANQHRVSIENFIRTSKLDIQLKNNLSAEEMVTLMQQCSTAITPPSTISYEYLSTGGKLFLKVIADNQLSVFNYLVGNGLAFSLEDFTKKELDIETVIQKQATVFDGQQAERLLAIFQNL